MAHSIVIKIRTDNDAFEPDETGEVARILRDAADRIETFALDRQPDDNRQVTLYDINGNLVGSLTITRLIH